MGRLMVDFNHVDKEILQNNESLLQLMTDMVDKINLTPLSIHCHTLTQMEKVCTGVLQKGHISLRTWSKFGVCSLDMLTNDTESLIPMLQELTSLFIVPPLIEPEEGTPSTYRWTYKE